MNNLKVNLKENDIQVNDSYNDILGYLKNKPVNDKTNNAIKALEKIKDNGIKNSSIDMKEMDALNMIYGKINSYTDSELKNNAKENLYEELASMVEYDSVVCSTGRITRIVDTLNGFDDTINIKPLYVIREEMLSKSSSIRNKLAEEIGENNPQFQSTLKDRIVVELNNDYKDVLSKDKIDVEINSWIDYVE